MPRVGETLQPKFLILTALQMEAHPIARALGASSPAKTAIDLRVIGIRGKSLPAVEALGPLRLILLAGLAGGLDPVLRSGEVVIDDPGLVVPEKCAARAHRENHLCRSHHPRRIIKGYALFTWSRAPRRWIWSLTPCAPFAEKAGVPFVNIRESLDTAGESLDPAAAGLVDEEGRVKYVAAIALLARRPGRIAQLVRLRRQTEKALCSLAAAVRDVAVALASTEELHGPR